jgi:hypothetical protein
MLQQSGSVAQLYEQMVYWGFIRPTRDFAVSLRILMQKGLVAQLGSAPDSLSREPLDDMERAVTRIRQLFTVHGSTKEHRKLNTIQ